MVAEVKQCQNERMGVHEYRDCSPILSVDQWKHETLYGDEYQIDCTWVAKSEQQTDADGKEFVSKYEIFTENPAPNISI